MSDDKPDTIEQYAKDVLGAGFKDSPATEHFKQKESDCITKLSQAVRDLTVRVEKLENRKARTIKPVKMWMSSQFEFFWEKYPKPNSGKQAAVKAWNKLKPNASLIDEIWEHFYIGAAYENTEPCFIPNASTYLNGEKWKDAIIEVKVKLLKPPAEDDKLDTFAREHGLSLAQPGLNYWDYRALLNREIEDKGLTV